MRLTLARAIVRIAAWLVPDALRARWREEWLGEIESQNAQGKRQRILQAALGAPRDAVATRRLHHQARRGTAPGLANDIRHSLRLIVRSPGHVAMVVASLSIGLTATIVALAVLSAIFRGEPPGVRDRQTLTRVEALFNAGGGLRAPRDEFSRHDLEVLQGSLPHPRSQVDEIAASGALKVTIRIGDGVESVVGRFVSGNYFDVLGTRPAVGRLLTPADDRLDADVAVISHDFWQQLFQGRLDAIGQRFVAGNRVVQIVGVTPAGFNPYRFAPVVQQRADPLSTARIILPLSLARGWPGAPAAGDAWLTLAARLKPGGSRHAGQEELKPAARALEAVNPAIGRDLEFMLNDFVLGRWAGDPDEVASVMAVLLTGPLILLAIGCANVVNLRLARATRRTHELAVRLALGASRARLVRLLLVEAGAIASVALAASWAAARTIVHHYGGMLLLVSVPFDDAVLASALIAGAIVIIFSGLGPAWLVTRRATVHGLKQTPQAGGLAHSRLRATLVVVQVALSIVVLAIGSLFARSLQTVNSARAGIIDQLLVANLDLASQGYDSPVAAQFARTLLARLQNDSRFTAVGMGTAELFGGESVRIRPTGMAEEIRRGIATSHVTPEWFDSMNLRPLAGRLFASHDRGGVAIVNETAARLLTQGGSPVGMPVSVQRFRRVAGALVTRSEIAQVAVSIIGVVPDSVRRPDRPLNAVPWIYFPLDALPEFPTVLTVFARTSQPAELAPDLSRQISDTDRRAPWTRVQTASEIFSTETNPARSLAAGVGSSGLVALGLAAAGLFAVLAYSVSLRSREIGIRMALGAAPRQVTALVLRQALRLALAGIAIGYALALPIAYAIRVVFLGISPVDPLAMVPVAIALIVTAFIAAAVPARRAASVDPVAILRAE